MTTYLFGELKFTADRDDELVNEMRDADLTPATSDKDFMKNMASRVKFNSGHDVRADSAANFVADMLAAGQLKIIPDDVEEEGKDETAEK
jgi:hypothetical protein